MPPTQGDLNLVHADENFHETLALASRSTVLASMLDQHSAILHTLIAGDARLAQAMLRAHILESHAFVRTNFLKQREMQP